MPHVSKLFDPDKLEFEVRDKMVTARRHPRLPLTLYNYSANCQFDNYWTEVTTQCRGLILDDAGKVVARPFRKFFNLNTSYRPETHEANLPHEKPEIYDKLDGCFLGNTKLNLWDGGTIKIRDVVSKRLKVKLIGQDKNGNIVPCEVIDWFDNGYKKNWLLLTVDCLPSKLAGSRTGNHITVTPNHHIWINGKFRQALEAKVGDIVTTFESWPNDFVLHFMESSLLGDGSISPVHNTFAFSESHSYKYSEYVKELRNWLGKCDSPRQNSISGYGSELYWAASKKYKSLSYLRKKWYPNGIKEVPQDLQWMDNFSVAVWYMGDGSLTHNNQQYQKDRANFATDSFSLSDVWRLADRLKEMYNVDAVPQLSKGRYSLRVNAGNGEINKMWESIAPHIHPTMRYKLPMEYRNIPYIEKPQGNEIIRRKDVKILNVRIIPPKSTYFAAGKKGFDIKTTTGNYFAKGVLVHNSLGLLWHYDGEYGVATRGSFESDQAKWATKLFNEKYLPFWFHKQEPFYATYLFEIIYNANKIVVDYSFEDLVLLTVVNNTDGIEWPYSHLENLWPWKRVEQFDTSLEKIRSSDEKTNAEGYVLFYREAGLRVKVKFAEYMRLHRLIFGLNPRHIWEALKSGSNLDDLSDNTTISFKYWLDDWKHRLESQYYGLVNKAYGVYDSKPIGDRRTIAEHFKRYPEVAAICFSMLDNDGVLVEQGQELVWKLCKPAGMDSFRKEGEK